MYLHSKQYMTGICDYSHELIDLDKIKHEKLFSDTKLSDINTIYDHAASKLRENLTLEAELKISQSELESMKAKQAGEQAALKTALMRGVCALNMETMAVFNETLPNMNKEFINKKFTVDSQILNKNYCTDDHLELAQLTSKKLNGCHSDKTIHNQSDEMIFNIQADHIMQATHQSSEYTKVLALMLQHTNGYHTEFSNQNRQNSMEAWPRDTIRNVEPSYSNVVRKGNCAKPLSHSTEICERWLGHSDYSENDPLNLSGLPTYKTHDRHLHTIQSLSYQVDEKISNSDPSELEHDNQMDNKWLPNKDLVPNKNYDTSFRININSTNSKHEKPDRSLYDGKTHTTVENAKKMLSSRNSSNRFYSTVKQNKLSSYPRPQTVQHGIPTGSYPNGSTAMVNILVQRHQTGNQINSTENVNTHKHTTNSTGVHYSHCQHNLSSTPRLYSDSYSHRHV
ncbi:uncharacterized protein DC041_0012490 [Schistosoma bovis]|uniref:Centrosomal protein POC5 n=1 Tax=Schistosoma bovis TaxID=6184 RepID=A0A430QKG1_SCHBO|nr:uncharacterized protein DC041_0012490 [Schistosoma bovis]